VSPEIGAASGAWGSMIAASVDVEGALLLLKAAFLVLLYLFIWRIVRTASRDLRVPQESFVIGPQQAAAVGLRPEPEPQVGRLVVIRSSAIDENTEFELDSTGISIGRGGPNDVRLDGDDYASANHARVEPRRDGVWIEDVGSTNGTFVNGVRLSRARKLAAGDLVRVGDTDLRFET
jgi:FHA domain